MFEITGDHIAELSDEDLRSLIGLLCEAELRRRGLPVAAATWSGNQTAKDAGLDVRVSLPKETVIDGFVPRAATGFQVKQSDMPRNAIIDEMKPNNVLRPSIAALAQERGAYIIVSGRGSTADSALKNRRDAMAEAMQGEANVEKLTLDFFDRGRVATWVRDHPGIIPWVRQKIGKAIPGWRSYGAWSHTPDTENADYLADESARIKTETHDEGDGLSAIDGINRIRDVLRNPGQVVRLVGLSGVGKTRLLEALFDDKIGVNSLDPALAAYTNIADLPDPQPPGLASDLLAERRRAILVIDNCPPDLHQKLSEIVRVSDSTLSVITVEYDIREDQPEGTDVFTLEVSSTELIEKLVARRFPQLSQVDCRTIAEFSGGNARIAIAVADTVEKNETVAGLNDAELFRRLFHQRHTPDDSLLLIAQACSLVYSFQGHDLEGENAELPILGSLIGKSAEELYRGVAELRRRDLLQERGVWRAVLPHAIANRLAAMALENIPSQRIQTAIINGKSERILRSFSRRLGFLDGSKEARAIVSGWLAPGGLLSDTLNLNDVEKDIFNNIAPVVPETVLAVLESAIAAADASALARSKHFIRLIRSLAYDAEFFERAVLLLLRFSAMETESHMEDDATNVVASLFYIYLSGTHATADQRLSVINDLLRSPVSKLQTLGVQTLDHMFETSHFSSSYLFEFGARSRDHGYHPNSDADIARWFGSALRLAEEVAASDLPISDEVKKAIATNFRGLWSNAGRSDDLERIARRFAAEGFWRDGWVAARQTRTYGAKQLSPESMAQLKRVEELLRPTDLVARVRGIVLDAKGSGLDYDDMDDIETYDFETSERRIATAIEELGKDIAADTDAFKVLLPELLSGGGRVGALGHALAQGADKPRDLWDELVGQFGNNSSANPLILGSFLSGLQKSAPAEAEVYLDQAVDCPTLAAWFPYLQACVTIDEKGVARLRRALEAGIAPMDRYEHLAWGRASDPIPGPAFRDLVIAIIEKGGIDAALHMVSMRLVSNSTDKLPVLPETIEAGRAVLSSFEIGVSKRKVEREDHELGSLAKRCLGGNDGEGVARRLIGQLKEASADYRLRSDDYDDLVSALFAVHPFAMLDELFTGDDKAIKKGVQFVQTLLRRRKSPLDGVPPETLIAWCNVDPAQRYPLAAIVGAVYKKENDQAPLLWTPLPTLLLQNAPDPQALLPQIAQRLYFNSWSGSWATKMEGRARLFETLDVGNDTDLIRIKAEILARIRSQIDEARRKEAAEDRQRSARFE